MRSIIWTAILAVALPLTASLVVADDEPSPAPKTAGSDAALASSIEALIKQLGADDFRSREAASKQLSSLGESARTALEKATRASKSPEVRWRAGQILQQLAGVGEKPLGAEGGTDEDGADQGGKAGGVGGQGPRDTPRLPGDVNEAFARLREMMKKLNERGRSPFGGAFGNLFGAKQRIEAPGLVLERLRPGQVSLKVTRDASEEELQKNGEAKVEDVFVGSSLAEILSRNPELSKHAGMGELERLEAQKSSLDLTDMLKRGLGGIRVHPFPQGGGFGLTTLSDLSIKHDADGVTVTITENDENGKPQAKTYKGESIAAIKKAHPEIADKLGGFSVKWRVSPPDIFWPGQRDRRFKPLRPTTPWTRTTGPLFGLDLEQPDAALASHLRLAEGQGALVREVQPGSQAHALGVLVNDVIVKINDVSVTLESAVATLRKAAAAKAAGTSGTLTVEVMRRGETKLLSR